MPSEAGRKDRVHQIQNPDDTGFGYTGTRQNLGLAVAENIKTELIEISSDYGLECGDKIIKEVKHLISMKEEDLISIEIL